MTYFKKAHVVILHDMANIVEKRKDTLDDTETAQYGEFRGLLEDIDKENEKIYDRTAEQLKRFRKTEKWKETNRRNQRAYQERKRAAKAAAANKE